MNLFDQAMEHIHEDMLSSQWKRGEKEQVEELIAEHGWEKFVAAVSLYWRQQDPAVFERTLFKWTAFLNTSSGWLKKVTPAMLERQAQERFKATPEGKAQDDALQQDSIARQTAAITARMQYTPPANEETVEDFLKD